MMDQTKAGLRNNVGEAALRLLGKQAPIHSASQVRQEMEQTQEVPIATIQTVLRKDFSLSFGKVKKIPNQANSLRNLYKR